MPFYCIFNSSGKLRYIKLATNQCFRISDKGWIEAVANIPLFEELEITHDCPLSIVKFLVAVGRSCPLLKSLKLRSEVNWESNEYCNLSAFAIAENMLGLVSLVLDGNRLTDDAVQAILEGCPRLQSLEIRHCLHVTMKGDFGRRCSERIKDLRFHYFSHQELERMVEDCKFLCDEGYSYLY